MVAPTPVANVAHRLPPAGWTTRYAPAPTGRLHLGHVVNALWVWGLARAFGGRVLLRIEDHDRQRCRPELERGLLEDLAWLGFEPDGDVVSGRAWVRQSDREELYARALDRLAAAGLVFVCDCARRDIVARSGAAPGEEPRYPGTCRDRELEPRAAPMRRVRLPEDAVGFDDLLLGPQRQGPAEQVGDLLVRDREGNWTYQFAVVVDDLEQGIDVVVRGEDLLASTGRQILLARLLGRNEPPVYLHHPLVYRPDGSKLSKSSGDTAVAELRRSGWSAERVLGAAAAAVGWIDRGAPLALRELTEAWARARPLRS